MPKKYKIFNLKLIIKKLFMNFKLLTYPHSIFILIIHVSIWSQWNSLKMGEQIGNKPKKIFIHIYIVVVQIKI